MTDSINPGYGDNEPEDAYDPGDAFPMIVDNLFRRLALLDAEPIRYNRRELLDIIQARCSRYQIIRGVLSDRDRLRLDQLVEDLATLRARVDE